MAFDLTGYRIINGTARADKLIGGLGQNAIFGFEGADTLVGNTGNDILDGGAGADTMAGGAGNDIYVVDSGKEAFCLANTDAVGRWSLWVCEPRAGSRHAPLRCTTCFPILPSGGGTSVASFRVASARCSPSRAR